MKSVRGSNNSTQADYVIEDRTLTTADFIAELQSITRDYLQRRNAFYKLIFMRIGMSLSKTVIAS